MRELFEDQGIQQPSDPLEAARQNSRPVLPKRFYKEAGIAPRAEGDGFAIALDGRTIRTPAKRVLVAPHRAIADALVAEWNAQGEFVDPSTMPLTRLANSVIDGITDRTADVAADIAKFFSSDLLFYRADAPQELIDRQTAAWDPVLRWITDQFGARFVLAEGIMPVAQPDQAVAAMRRLLPDDPWRLGALHVVTTTTGSALLAMRLMLAGSGDADTIWRAANIDEDWNAETWGEDSEALKRRERLAREFRAAALVLKALRDGGKSAA
jgi:chaperone required for assembly of F1-ATPase